MNEEIIIEECKKNREKFSVLYDRFYPDIFIFTRRRLESDEMAKEVSAVVFAKALNSIGRYKNTGVPFFAWLVRIAQNEVYKTYRRKNTWRFIELSDSGAGKLMQESEADGAYEELLPSLKAHLSKLKKEEITLIEYRFFEEYSFKQMAEILGCTETNARVMTHRVVEKLRKKMKQ